MDKEFKPKWIAWEITRKCNLNCIHCRSSSCIHSSQGKFTTKDAYDLIDQISDYYKSVVVLSGGEPLLREDCFDIAKYGTEKGLRMCLATNGTLVTDEICKKIKQSGIKIVSLSLDGSCAKIHDDFRKQPGAFDGVMRAINLFREKGIEFIINSSFTKRNQHDIANTFKLAKSLGATAWYMFMIVPTGRGEEVMRELISADDYEEILHWHFKQERLEKDILMRPTCAPHYYRIVIEENKKSKSKLERRSLKFSTGGAKGCIAGQTICFIDSMGEVYPCSYFAHSAGNVKEKTFKEIWEKSELFKRLRDFSSYKGRCGQCEYIRVCGGCRARAEAIYGDYLAEEPFCNYIPVKIRRKKEVK